MPWRGLVSISQKQNKEETAYCKIADYFLHWLFVPVFGTKICCMKMLGLKGILKMEMSPKVKGKWNKENKMFKLDFKVSAFKSGIYWMINKIP